MTASDSESRTIGLLDTFQKLGMFFLWKNLKSQFTEYKSEGYKRKTPQIFTKQNQNITSVTIHILETYILMQIFGDSYVHSQNIHDVSSKYRLGSRLQQYKNKSRYRLTRSSNDC